MQVSSVALLAIFTLSAMSTGAQKIEVAPQPQTAQTNGSDGEQHIDPRQLDAEPAFEVATIKPTDPKECCETWGRDGRHFETHKSTLRWLLQWAYGLNAKQIAGGPAWIDERHFDISGELEGTFVPTERQWRVAVQKLLTERFQLQVHHEQREMPAYAVVVARGGPKFAPGKVDPRAHITSFYGGIGQTMHGVGVSVTISQFFSEIQRLLTNKPIVDHTGLTGTYDMQIQFTREAPDSLGMTQLSDTAAPNLLDAMQQQLGLRLEGTKALADVTVIDHAELPEDN